MAYECTGSVSVFIFGCRILFLPIDPLHFPYWQQIIGIIIVVSYKRDIESLFTWNIHFQTNILQESMCKVLIWLIYFFYSIK